MAAIVLAGGRSSRFGRDKLAEPLDGRPLLHHAIDAVRGVTSHVIVVLAPATDRDLPADVLIAHDLHAFEGPLAGLATGLAALAALPAEVTRVLVVGGDMPSLSPFVLAALAAELEAPDAPAAVGLDAGGPLPMALRPGPARAAADALLAAGERRLRALPERLGARLLPGATWRALDPTGATLLDIDRPGDLRTLSRPP